MGTTRELLGTWASETPCSGSAGGGRGEKKQKRRASFRRFATIGEQGFPDRKNLVAIPKGYLLQQ